jgi:hypothetical protein
VNWTLAIQKLKGIPRNSIPVLLILLIISLTFNFSQWLKTKELKILNQKLVTSTQSERELPFIRFFFENYALNSLQGNFQKQRRLAAFASPKLREQILADLDRLESRASDFKESPNLSTKIELSRVIKKRSNNYEVDLASYSDQKVLRYGFSLEKKSDPLSEFPYQINRLEFLKSKSLDQKYSTSQEGNSNKDFSDEISKSFPISVNQFSVFEFTCSIESVSVNPKESLQFKMSNLDVTQLQLSPSQASVDQVSVDIHCPERSYNLNLTLSQNEYLLYLKVSADFLSPKHNRPLTGSPGQNQKNTLKYNQHKIDSQLDKKIKSELGFIIED